MPTKTIYVRDADAELWSRAEARAQGQGDSLSELLTKAVSEHLDLFTLAATEVNGETDAPPDLDRLSLATLDANGETDAPHGQKMIWLEVGLFTNSIAKGSRKILPKHAWGWGVVRIRPNKAHGIKPIKPEVFHSLLELLFAIEKLLVKAGITIHPGQRMGRYLR